jgi:hypothetical protein
MIKLTKNSFGNITVEGNILAWYMDEMGNDISMYVIETEIMINILRTFGKHINVGETITMDELKNRAIKNFSFLDYENTLEFSKARKLLDVMLRGCYRLNEKEELQNKKNPIVIENKYKNKFLGLIDMCKLAGMYEEFEGVYAIKLNNPIELLWKNKENRDYKLISINKVWFEENLQKFMLKGVCDYDEIIISEDVLKMPESDMLKVLNRLYRDIAEGILPSMDRLFSGRK